MRTTRFAGRISIGIALAVLIALALPQFAGAAPRNIYVEVGGTGNGTLESPYGSVATALTNAVSGDTIYVGEGTFIGCYTLKSGVALIGEGADKTTLQGNGTQCVLYGISLIDSTVVSGFTITGGTGLANTMNPATGQYIAAKVGGGIVLLGGGAPLIENNIIRNNDAWHWEQGLGGAMYLSGSWARIRNNTIINNRAGSGGAIYANTGAKPTIENNYISGNTAASFGGGIAFGEHVADVPVSRNTITANGASWGGGGISVASGAGPNIINNLITNNAATGTVGRGGGIFCIDGAGPRITNNTITGNTAKLYASAIGAEYATTQVVIKNCIMWGNRKTGTATPDSIRNVSPTYSCIEGGSGGTGNIFGDPLFVNAASGDYSLLINSPAINTGTALNAGTINGAPLTDYLGTARPQGAGFDMGAFERAATQLTVPALDNAVSVTFQDVVKSATTAVVKQPLASGQKAPTGFALTGDAYYDISPTGSWDRSNQPAQVTLRFDDTGMSDAEKASIRLFHYSDSGTWEDITSVGGLNLGLKTVSGTTTSFSGFGVFYTEDPEAVVSVDASSWWTLALMVSGGFGIMAIGRSRRTGESTSHKA